MSVRSLQCLVVATVVLALGGACSGVRRMPRIDSTDPSERVLAVAHASPEELGRRAIEDPDFDVRRSAVERLVDQTQLARVATLADNPSIRQRAVL